MRELEEEETDGHWKAELDPTSRINTSFYGVRSLQVSIKKCQSRGKDSVRATYKTARSYARALHLADSSLTSIAAVFFSS